jgi:hypothetical protein
LKQDQADKLSSGDSDEDDYKSIETKNFIYGFYEKVNRNNGKWRIVLKDSIARI